ncbi:hypothetical protein BDD12DRAFT_193858 [Trichophaea hybrida]|nr:hypothetical protein BDD12DRAFT_193858 [Trichophaea hybrida]
MASGMLSLWTPSQLVITIIDQPIINYGLTLHIEFGDVNTATIIQIITVETPKGYQVNALYTPTIRLSLLSINQIDLARFMTTFRSEKETEKKKRRKKKRESVLTSAHPTTRHAPSRGIDHRRTSKPTSTSTPTSAATPAPAHTTSAPYTLTMRMGSSNRGYTQFIEF